MLPAAESSATAPDYTVFFELDSAALTADAIAAIDRILRDPARPTWTRIQVAGHADRSGSERYNNRLSADRAEAVRQYLIGAGVPASSIVTAALGEKQGLVGTPDGVVEPQNRRAEIFLRSK